jgi:hypothetical protein
MFPSTANSGSSSSTVNRRQRSPPSHIHSPKTIIPTEFDPNFLRWMKGLDTNRQRKELMSREPDQQTKEKVLSTAYQGSRHQKHHALNQQNFTKHHVSPSKSSPAAAAEKKSILQNNQANQQIPPIPPHEQQQHPSPEKEKLQQTRRERSDRMSKVAESLGKLRQFSPTRPQQFISTEKDDDAVNAASNERKSKREMMNAFGEHMSRNTPRTVVIENTEEKKKRKKQQHEQEQNSSDNKIDDEGLPSLSARQRQESAKKQKKTTINNNNNNFDNDDEFTSENAFQRLRAMRTNAAMRVFARGFQNVVTVPAVKNHQANQQKILNDQQNRMLLISGGGAGGSAQKISH